jgi:putative transposase
MSSAAVETLFKTIKAELIWRHRWHTLRQARTAIFQYINGFYNPRRRHSYLGGISPLAFEAKAAYRRDRRTGTKPLQVQWVAAPTT